MAGRVVAVTGLGDVKSIEAAFRKAGLVVNETADSMVNSSKRAGEAAAAQAREMGASVDEQAAAAGRAAAAYVGAQDEMSRAQKAAAKAAADAARAAKLSAEEQQAAAERAAAAAVESGNRIGQAFDNGTSKAGGALKKLGSLGATWGIPFSGSLEKIGKEFDQTSSKGEKLHTTLAAMGKLSLFAGGIGATAAAYEGIKGAATLEKQMEMIHTQAGASQAEVKHLTNAVLGLSGSVATGPKTLAEGLYHVESVGLRGAKAMEVLKIAAEGAKVGNANLVDETNALDAAIVSGIPGVQNYGQAMGDLNATVGAGDMRAQDLAEAYGTGLLGAVKHTGVAINDTNAALAVFGDNNIRGADAGTKLSSALRIMAGPSAAASKALAAIGMSATEMGADLRSPHGLLKALEDLHSHLAASGATPEQTNLILNRAFGGKQATGVELLLGQLTRLEEKYKQIDHGAGNFGKDWSAEQHTLAFETEQLKAETQALADKFGLFLIPKLQGTEHAISDVVSWMEKHKTVAEALGLTIAGVLGLALAVFAEQKAVAFGKATLRMFDDMSKLASGVKTKTGEMAASFGEQDAAAEAASAKVAAAEAQEAEAVAAADAKIQAENTAAAGSFNSEAAAAEAATATVDGAVASEAAAVQSANAEIEASNTAAGASFAGLASKIGAIGVAFAAAEAGAHAFGSALESITGEKQAKSIGELFGGTNEHTDEGQGSINAWNKAQGQRVLNTGGGIMAFFESKGLTPAEAAGIVGNFQQESSLNFKAPGGGIDQGLGSRDHSRLNSVGQLEAIWRELVAGEGGVLRIFHEHPHMGPAEAARIFSERFERPGVPMLSNRERYATEAFRAHPHAHGSAGSHHGSPTTAPAGHPSAGLQEYLESASGHGRKHAEAYADPFAQAHGLHHGRTDQGVDFTATPGSPIDAIGAGVVDAIIHNWYKGQPLIEEKLTSGSHKGQYVYDAEQIASGVRVGQHLRAGQMIGRVAPSGTGLELGFGAGGGRTLAQATTGYHEGQVTTAGVDFRKFLASIGKGGSVLSVLIKQQEAEEALFKRLDSKGGSLLKKYQSDIQSGSIPSLEKITGYSSKHTQGHGSQAYKEYEGLVHELRAAHVAALSHLASELVGAHRDALKALNQELHADRLRHDAETLQLRADKLRDEQHLASDTSAGQLQIAKDQEQQVVDAMRSAAQHIEDMTQLISGRFAAMAQTVEDQTRIMADSSAGVVQSIRDQTQVNVDILGERGLYGLNLIAQQEQVQLDQMKLSYDKQIEQARVSLDQLKAQEDQTVAQKQQVANELQLQDDTQLAKLEAHFDAIQLAEHQAAASARQHLDLVTLQRDSDVDAKQIIAAIDTGKKRSVEEEASAELKRAEKYRTLVIQEAQGELSSAETRANQDITRAQNELEGFKAQASQAQAKARQELEEAKGNATVVLAQAQQSLQGLENKATESEARLEKEIAEIRAEAQTQYAGSGLNVTITGINPTDSAAIASEVGWVLKTQVPA